MATVMQRLPLRVKLIAAVLALLAAALVVIGAAGPYALHRYLVGRIDSELVSASSRLDPMSVPQHVVYTFVPPTSWLVTIRTSSGYGITYPLSLTAAEQPVWPTTEEGWERLPSGPFTARSFDGATKWRLVVATMSNGEWFVVGQSLDDVDGATSRLIVLELIIGSAALVVLTSVGVALIRRTLRPLVEMESTAAAIAAGDLTRRVPELEPGEEPPRTEVGTLGRSLNVMLDQIERAFAARQASEEAARQAAEIARRSEARALRSEERMRQFAADASHELRTPLTTIRGFAELYRQGAATSPEEVGRLVRRIEDEASRMGMLVEDLLLLARLDQERPLEREPVDLRIIAADAVVAARAAAPDRAVELEVAPDTGALIVLGDDLRLRQVVGNLMTNALTHTPTGTPVTLRLAADAGYGELSVTDLGPGLAEDQLDRIFERFYRVDTARTRRMDQDPATRPVPSHPAGTGLGLPIVGALVTAHGGTVDVRSAPSQGATFTVRLPLYATADDVDDAELTEVADTGIPS
jgi:two-component system, OmpR family, sensor kinase